MRRSFVLLLLPCAALVLTLSGACGGNVVLDGQGGSGGATTSTSNGTTSTTVTSTTAGAGAGTGTTATSSGGTTLCLSCADRLGQFEMGVTSTEPVCAGAAQTAYNALLSCACGGTCSTACSVNACISQIPSGPCFACLAQGCGSETATCKGN